VSTTTHQHATKDCPAGCTLNEWHLHIKSPPKLSLNPEGNTMTTTPSTLAKEKRSVLLQKIRNRDQLIRELGSKLGTARRDASNLLQCNRNQATMINELQPERSALNNMKIRLADMEAERDALRTSGALRDERLEHALKKIDGMDAANERNATLYNVQNDALRASIEEVRKLREEGRSDPDAAEYVTALTTKNARQAETIVRYRDELAGVRRNADRTTGENYRLATLLEEYRLAHVAFADRVRAALADNNISASES